MQPVRIKYYLVSVTRRQYLTVQVILAALLVAVLAVWFAMPMPEALRQASPDDFRILLLQWFWKHFLWICLAATVLEGIETLLMLKKFARKEAEQQAGSLRTETTTSPNPNPS